MAKLKPAFKKDGSVTAGNSCGRNDAGAAIVLMSEEKARELGVKPLARIVTDAVVGVPPQIMGIGPIPAVRKALAQANMTLSDIELIELNEAFASQSLAVIRELGLDMNKVNVNGGAIALGHPIGATGARLMTTLLYEMHRRKLKYGMVTLCIGGGQGMEWLPLLRKLINRKTICLLAIVKQAVFYCFLITLHFGTTYGILRNCLSAKSSYKQLP